MAAAAYIVAMARTAGGRVHERHTGHCYCGWRGKHDARSDGPFRYVARKSGFGFYKSSPIEARYPGIQFSQFMAPR